MKLEGPDFGTNVGQGLAVGQVPKPVPKMPTLKCPNTLELRQIIQYKPVDQNLRDQLQSRLIDYAKFIIRRDEDIEALKIQDPRSEEEKILAADLQVGYLNISMLWMYICGYWYLNVHF